MATQNSLQTTNQPQSTFTNFIAADKVKGALMNSLCDPKEVQKFTSSIVSAVSTNPALQSCDYSTVISAGLLANALGLSLSPQLGLCYMVPFEDNKRNRTVATFILGYRGYIQLAVRSGQYKRLNAMAIKEGELIRYDPLNEEIEIRFIQDERLRDKAKTIGYYAGFEYLNGFKKVLYWSRSKMEVHADRYSPAFSLEAKPNKKKPEYSKVSFADFVAGKVPEDKLWLYSSFWYKDFDGMALKTMLRQLISKWGVMSIEMEKAVVNDGAYTMDDGSINQTEHADFETAPAYIAENVKEIEPDAVEDIATEKTQKNSNKKSVEDDFFSKVE